MQKKFSGTAVILAGGQGRRMQGESKAFLQIGGVSILDRLEAVLEPLFSEIILVVKSKEQLKKGVSGFKVILDQYPDQSAMAGIHAGLLAAITERIFVVACDMPFLQPEVVQKIWTTDDAVGIVVPQWRKQYQPLCATYRKICLPQIASLIHQKNFKLENLFSKETIKVISMKEIEAIDPQGKSFININRPKDLEMAQRIMEEAARVH